MHLLIVVGSSNSSFFLSSFRLVNSLYNFCVQCCVSLRLCERLVARVMKPENKWDAAMAATQKTREWREKLLQILLLSRCRHKNVIYFVFNFYLKLVSVRKRVLDWNLCIRSPQSHFSCNPFQLVWIDSMGSRSVYVGAFQIVGWLLLFRFIISSHYYGFEHDSQMNMNARSLQTATTPESGKVLWGLSTCKHPITTCCS